MQEKVWILVLAILSVAGLFIQPSYGKEYPAQTIEITVPYQAGGVIDILSRLVANIAPKYLGQPVVVINKPGASGSIGASTVAASKSDGYKLLATDQTYFSMTVRTQESSFDPAHLVPLACLVEFKRGLAIRGDSPWKNLSDLLGYARKNPGRLMWAHPGRGLPAHLNGLLIFRKTGVETKDIPYKGNPEMTAALLGEHVDAISIPYAPIRGLINEGKIKYLVTFHNQRFNDLLDVPCATEIGFPEAAKLAVFMGLFIHKDTPEKIKKTLLDSLKKTYDDPEFKKGIQLMGEEPKWGGPEFLTETIRKAEEVGVPIIKELGLYVAR
jgi:tripartite-type tricarboxylate transporter receptor subunit TctC